MATLKCGHVQFSGNLQALMDMRFKDLERSNGYKQDLIITRNEDGMLPHYAIDFLCAAYSYMWHKYHIWYTDMDKVTYEPTADTENGSFAVAEDEEHNDVPF